MKISLYPDSFVEKLNGLLKFRIISKIQISFLTLFHQTSLLQEQIPALEKVKLMLWDGITVVLKELLNL